MSHLSILPTLVNDLELLATALRAEGFSVELEGQLCSFETRLSVALSAKHPTGLSLGWTWNQHHDALDVVIDLGKPSRSVSVKRSLSRVLRRYALQKALRDADRLNVAVVGVDEAVTSPGPASVRS